MDLQDGVPPTADLAAYRKARHDRSADALIVLFSGVLGKPLARRELTPEQHARREARLRERKHRSS